MSICLLSPNSQWKAKQSRPYSLCTSYGGAVILPCVFIRLSSLSLSHVTWFPFFSSFVAGSLSRLFMCWNVSLRSLHSPALCLMSTNPIIFGPQALTAIVCLLFFSAFGQIEYLWRRSVCSMCQHACIKACTFHRLHMVELKAAVDSTLT